MSTHESIPSKATPAHATPPARRRVMPAILLGLDSKLLLLTCLVGALAGVLATGYFWALTAFLHFSAFCDGHVPVFLLMPAAGLLVGLTYLLGHPGETDAVVDNIHVQNGRMDTAANLPLIPCSLISISAGGSAGPEAPMVYLTGSVGTWLHRWLKLPEEHVRTLTFAGMGVGFATLFGAPVGSAIFALEIPHKRGMEYYEATVPAIIGCLVGYGVFTTLTHHGIGPIWHFTPYTFQHGRDLVSAVGVGTACGLASFLFIGLIRLFGLGFKSVSAPMWIKASVGGLLLGLVAWKLPATRFWAEEQLQSALIDAKPALGFLLLLAVAKMATVSVTLASGWRGGIIIPCFFIGACLGKAIALVCPWIDPTLGMLCGMAAVNVAIMKVPLATILVVAGMSGIAAVPPIAAAAFAAFVVTGGINFLQTKRDRVHDDPASEDEVDSALRAITAESEAARTG